jgi:S1-C subfamily serine protease
MSDETYSGGSQAGSTPGDPSADPSYVAPPDEQPTEPLPSVEPRPPFSADAPADAASPPASAETNAKARPVLTAVLVSIIAAFVVAAFAGAAAGFFGATVALDRGATAPSGTIRVTGQTNEPVAAAAAAALPSVVNIDISGDAIGASGASGLPTGHPNVPLQGNGSGVAFKRAGAGTYIVTNNHVVAGATSIVVTPVGGDRLKGTLVGADPDTDIAVVRIDKALPLIQVGDSKKVAVGDLAVAIGSPFGLEHSVTSGVLSDVHRSLPPSAADASGTASLVDVIQTDAAINPGNSGGALVDRQGRLVGINSAIFSSSGSNDGIGFAIPVNTAIKVADELIANGKVRHPFLGIIGQSITDSTAKQKKLPVSEGALVISVVKGSGAEQAGLKPNDVIVQLDSTRIRSMEDLIGAVREAGVGTTVTLKLYRNGKTTAVQMTVGVKPSNL